MMKDKQIKYLDFSVTQSGLVNIIYHRPSIRHLLADDDNFYYEGGIYNEK